MPRKRKTRPPLEVLQSEVSGLYLIAFPSTPSLERLGSLGGGCWLIL